MHSKPVLFLSLAAALTIATAPLSARAQTMEVGVSPAPVTTPSVGQRPPITDLSLESSYTAARRTRFRGSDFADSDAFNASLSLRTRVPLSGGWAIPLELRSQNIWLGSASGVPVPDRINTLQIGTGLSYRPDASWMFTLHLTPTLYKFNEIGGNDVGLSGGFLALWRYSPALKLMFGLMVAPDSDLKVLPIAGFDWAINDRLDLSLLFPKPRLSYRIDENLRVYTGFDLNMATFRARDSFGNSVGDPRYHDALGNYRDIRFGAGVGYRFNRTASLEADAGYSINRQITYRRIDESVYFAPAPYARLALKLGF